MADAAVVITSGTGTNIDTRTEATNGNHRQVVVLGDPSTNAGVAPVDATAGLKVDLGADNDVTVTGSVTADLGVNNDVTVTSGTITAVTDITNPVAVTQSGTWDEVGINDSGNSITVDNPQLSVVGSGTEATAMRVTLATDSTGVLSVDDNGGALTVDGTVAISNSSIPVTDNSGSLTVDNGGTFVTQENGALLTSAQLIDDVVYTDDTSTHSTGSSKGVGIMATATPTDTSVNANDIGMVAMTTDRRLLVDASGVAVPITDNSGSLTVDGTVAISNSSIPVTDNSGSLTVDYATTGSGTATGALRVELPTNGTGVIATVGAVTAITNALPAGTNAIGKLAANSGVDIGDVDVTSVAAGTNLIGDVGIQPRTTLGFDTFMASGSDGSSILVATAQAVKASAGKVYGYYIYNPEAAVSFVHFYNTASGSVTVGTTNPLFTLAIPAGSAANLMSEIGITFGTAITVAATTTAGGNTAPATGVSAVIWYK